MLGRMVELQKLWDDALVDAAKTKAAKENTAGDGSVQEQARQAYENKTWLRIAKSIIMVF